MMAELRLDMGIEQIADDRPLDYPGRGQPVTAERRDEGLGVPVAKRGVIVQPLADGRPFPTSTNATTR